MKIFLKQDIPGVGMAGEVVKVKQGFANNYLVPRKLGVLVTRANAAFYATQTKTVEHRKEVIESETSMLAERIKSLTLKIKKKSHDDGKLYGAIGATEVVDALREKGIKISKSQVKFDKSIKEKGRFSVTIKLSSRLMPQVTVEVVAE